MKLLLHLCCANCAIYPLLEFQKEGFEVWGFFYNPNIHPYQEYQRRLKTLKEFAASNKLKIIYRDEYPLEEFLRKVAFRENQRCKYCYNLRLTATVEEAERGNFAFFSTTLLYSKFQDHQLIKKIGEGLSKKYKIKFYYQDFRKGWMEGIKISKELNLYRQKYCGCIYSEKERFEKK